MVLEGVARCSHFLTSNSLSTVGSHCAQQLPLKPQICSFYCSVCVRIKPIIYNMLASLRGEGRSFLNFRESQATCCPHFSLYANGCIAIKLGADNRVPFGMNFNNFGDPLTFPLVPSGQNFNLLFNFFTFSKYLQSLKTFPSASAVLWF